MKVRIHLELPRDRYLFGLVNTAPIDANSWTYHYSTVAAPDGVFQRDFTLMLNVWRSWSLNQQMLRDRIQDAASRMRQTGEILRSAARGQSEAYDRANKGFSYYLRGSRCSSRARRARAATSTATSPTRS